MSLDYLGGSIVISVTSILKYGRWMCQKRRKPWVWEQPPDLKEAKDRFPQEATLSCFHLSPVRETSLKLLICRTVRHSHNVLSTKSLVVCDSNRRELTWSQKNLEQLVLGTGESELSLWHFSGASVTQGALHESPFTWKARKDGFIQTFPLV